MRVWILNSEELTPSSHKVQFPTLWPSISEKISQCIKIWHPALSQNLIKSVWIRIYPLPYFDRPSMQWCPKKTKTSPCGETKHRPHLDVITSRWLKPWQETGGRTHMYMPFNGPLKQVKKKWNDKKMEIDQLWIKWHLSWDLLPNKDLTWQWSRLWVLQDQKPEQ